MKNIKHIIISDLNISVYDHVSNEKYIIRRDMEQSI